MPPISRIFVALITTVGFIPIIFLRCIPFNAKTTAAARKKMIAAHVILLLGNAAFLYCNLQHLEAAVALVRADILLLLAFMVVLNIIFIPGYAREHAYTFGVSTTCLSLCLALSTYISQTIPNLNPAKQYIWGNVIYILLLLLSYVPVKKLLEKTVKPFLRPDCSAYWKGIWFVPVLLLFGMFFALPIGQVVNTLPALFNRAANCIVILLISYYVAHNHQAEMERAVMAEHLNLSKVYYADIQAKVDSTRRINHDIKHIVSLVRHYIETDDKEGLLSLCDQTAEKLQTKAGVPYSGNAAADGVIYHYMCRAKESDIRFRYRGSIAGSGVSDMDICVLLGNALDNAFAACQTAGENGEIDVIAQTEENMISIVVRNTFDGKMDVREDVLFSRKRDGRVGVGMESMRTICEKYNGSMKIDWDEHRFSVLFILMF